MKTDLELAGKPGNGRRILVADDGLVTRKLLERKLSQLAFEVVCASDGTQALERVREVQPSAVITDLNMPGLNGYELCRAIRQDLQLPSIPLILTSAANVNETDLQKARDAGANRFVTRTADLSDVISALLDTLDGASGGIHHPG